jgi:riboflavin kinase / FMN adenylyltransferase
MKILEAEANLKALGITCSTALGMFDGVHLGHKKVIEAAVQHAYKHKQKSAVITLSRHPRELTEGKAPELITNLAARLNLFEKLGLDYVLVLDFNEELKETSARDFFQKYLLNFLNTNFISIGYDHHFGKNRSGNPQQLKEWCSELGLECQITPALEIDGNNVSSSRIRDLIKQGDLNQSNKLLGHEYLICSEIIQGEGLGHKLGFPTANLALDSNLVYPHLGVYYGHCVIANEKQSRRCLINIGIRPSVSSNNKLNIEVHILNFNENIYGKSIQLSLSKRIRDEIKFTSIDKLQEQIQEDIKLALTLS